MKRHLGAIVVVATDLVVGLGSSAFAADNPAPPTVPTVKAAPVPNFSWTGCYFGVGGGGDWGDSEQIARSGNNAGAAITGNFRLGSGGIAGGTLGCDYQVEKTVMGLENDASWTRLGGATQNLPAFNIQGTSSTRETWIDTLRGRVGYAFDHFLVYGTAGAAFAGTNVVVSDRAMGTFSDSRSRVGLAMGIGAEWAAWTGSWGTVSFKLEYLHADFGSRQYFSAPIIGAATIATRDVKLTDDIVQAGVNVRLNWGPTVIAK